MIWIGKHLYLSIYFIGPVFILYAGFFTSTVQFIELFKICLTSPPSLMSGVSRTKFFLNKHSSSTESPFIEYVKCYRTRALQH